MYLEIPSDIPITIEHEPACLRVRWHGDRLPPLFWVRPDAGRAGGRAIPLPAVRSVKIDIEQGELLFIYMACAANENQ